MMALNVFRVITVLWAIAGLIVMATFTGLEQSLMTRVSKL